MKLGRCSVASLHTFRLSVPASPEAARTDSCCPDGPNSRPDNPLGRSRRTVVYRHLVDDLARFDSGDVGLAGSLEPDRSIDVWSPCCLGVLPELFIRSTVQLSRTDSIVVAGSAQGPRVARSWCRL